MVKLKKTVRKLHKWASVTVGVFILAWLITGIVLVVPLRWMVSIKDMIYGNEPETPVRSETASATGSALAQLDFRGITITVPQAISVLEEELGQEVQVDSVTAARFGQGLAYEITLRDSSRHMVDALSGTRTKVTQAMAEQTARASVNNARPPVSVDLMHRRDYHYWGSLPVHRVSFDDSQRTVVYVSAVTGHIEQTTSRLSRLHHWVTSIHTFQPLRLAIERDAVRKGLLIVIAMVGIGVVVTGFYLALPVRRRSPQALKRTLTSVAAGDEELPADL
jgi:uncharacterized iron-regulated membrane protein